ncbi:hypothetical protein [Rhodoplanes sp. SY1]|uniref:hypothetical protein n=1 Tax=Rhodoplanes sp. SY1 TaxID=3166646 RepID=UPI0038B612C5
MKVISLASAVAISLGLSSAALAQQPNPATSGTPGLSSGNAAMPGARQSVSKGDIKDKLKQAGVEDREEFEGHLVTARAPSGHSVEFIVGPEDFEADKSVDFDRDAFRAKLTRAGFDNIRFANKADMVRGQMSGDKQVLAFSSGTAPAAGAAHSKSPGTSDLKNALEKVGLDDRSEFEGSLLTARTDQGSIRLLVGPEEFEGSKSVELSADDLSKLQRNGFSEAEMTKNVTMVRGKMNDLEIIALSGQGVGATTGSR